MRVIFHCKGRNDDLQLKTIVSDLEYTRWRIMKGLNDNIKRIRNDKNIVFRIVRLLMRLGKKMGMEEFLNLMENASESVSVYDYKVEKTDDGIKLEMTVRDLYFDIIENIPVVGIVEKVFKNKRHFVDEVIKSLRNEYGYESITFEIEEEKKV